jgi:hypothetical protein
MRTPAALSRDLRETVGNGVVGGRGLLFRDRDGA